MLRFLTASLLLTIVLATPGWCNTPVWMEEAERLAREDGYRIVDTTVVRKAIEKNSHLLVDVRADYEFVDGHLHGAANLEFDLGDRTDLSEAKRQALIDLLGPDRNRPIIVYCRSFR